MQAFNASLSMPEEGVVAATIRVGIVRSWPLDQQAQRPHCFAIAWQLSADYLRSLEIPAEEGDAEIPAEEVEAGGEEVEDRDDVE